MIRKPIVAGQFYRGDAKLLEKQISECFTHKFGPGSLPEKRITKDVAVAISPHAGYPYSGPCAAWVYKAIAESPRPDVYVMLGLSHGGFPSALSAADWQTPLGSLQSDVEYIKRVGEYSGLKVDERIHAGEHSIEVQLPFLQFVLKGIKGPRIAAITCSDDVSYEKIAGAVIKAADDLKRKIVIIASSDFTHFGASYGYTPFSRNIKESMYKLDNGAIGHIMGLDPSKFLDYVDEKEATICGRNPISVALQCAKLIGARKAGLLKYYTSADIMGEADYATAVGYAGIVFEKQK
jgi:AmmeMemoRadiSam system protein B